MISIRHEYVKLSLSKVILLDRNTWFDINCEQKKNVRNNINDVNVVSGTQLKSNSLEATLYPGSLNLKFLLASNNLEHLF